MNDWTEFSEWLRAEMKRRRISSYKLEDMTGICHSTIQEYMRGKHAPSLEKLLRIAAALGKQVLIIDK